jgi:hypothetical protein
MTCPVPTKGTFASRLSGRLSGAAPLVSGSCGARVRYSVRPEYRTHHQHEGLVCPVLPVAPLGVVAA